jgi:hypothetical protein
MIRTSFNGSSEPTAAPELDRAALRIFAQNTSACRFSHTEIDRASTSWAGTPATTTFACAFLHQLRALRLFETRQRQRDSLAASTRNRHRYQPASEAVRDLFDHATDSCCAQISIRQELHWTASRSPQITRKWCPPSRIFFYLRGPETLTFSRQQPI